MLFAGAVFFVNVESADVVGSGLLSDHESFGVWMCSSHRREEKSCLIGSLPHEAPSDVSL